MFFYFVSPRVHICAVIGHMLRYLPKFYWFSFITDNGALTLLVIKYVLHETASERLEWSTGKCVNVVY